MDLPFLKMEGCGNDFVVVDRLAAPALPVPDPDTIRRLADRRRGIGFDQLLVLEAAPAQAGAAGAFRIFNADGSVAGQCGNGARCIALLLAQAHDSGEDFVMLSPAGPMRAQVRGERVRVSMGAPAFAPEAVPARLDGNDGTPRAIEVEGESVTLGAVSMGNPHAVLVVEDVASARVASIGPAVQRLPTFPAGVNVGFLQVISRNHGRLRVFERGAGETAACGSGACAAMVVGRRSGLFDETVALDLPGGRLVVSWPGAGREVWLEGPANRVFEGHVTL